MQQEATMPPIVQRLHTRFARLSVAAILLATLCFSLFALSTLRILPYPTLWFVLGVACALASFASPIIQVRSISRLRSRARAANWRLCPHCGYDVQACTTPRCPECGRDGDPDRDARSWQAATDLTLRKSAD
jgi:hypothetical protein